jgi:hypothetical protein
VNRHKQQPARIQKRVKIPDSQTSSWMEGAPNFTSASPSFPETAASSRLSKDDSTSAPRLGEPDEGDIKYASSYPALLDKYAFSKWPVSKILILAILGWIIIQDNGAGKLANWQGILWTLQKSGVFLLLFLLVSLAYWAYQKIFKKS